MPCRMHAVVALALLVSDAGSELKIVDADGITGALLMATALDAGANAGA